MADSTPRLALPLIAAGQAQKELFHNEALALIDGLLQPAVVAVALNEPPASPAPGQAWIVGDAPGGGWAGQAKALAFWTEGGWRFVPPLPGMTVWSILDGLPIRFDGAAWTFGELTGRRVVIGGVPVVGTQQPAITTPAGGLIVDVQARAAISAVIGTLQRHGLIAT